MKATFFILISMFYICGCSNHQVLMDDDQAIRSFSDKWTNAIISKDLDLIIDLYAPDAVQLITFGPMLKGKEEIREWYKSWIYDKSLEYSAASEIITVAGSGDLAFERGTYKVNNETGRYITIWKKIDGNWKVISDNSIPEKQN